MKILLKLYDTGTPAFAAVLARDPVIAAATAPVENPIFGHTFTKWIDAGSPAFARIVELARDHREGLRFHRDLRFAAKEMAASTHFEVKCRRSVQETPGDYDVLWAAYQATPLRRTGDGWEVRWLERLFLARAEVKPDGINGVSEWMEEFALGDDVARSLDAAGFDGVEVRPVYHSRSKAERQGISHLYVGATLPPVARSRTHFVTGSGRVPEDPRTPRRYGALTWPGGALDDAHDFMRTAEPYGPWEWPVIVVSSRVRDWYEASGWKGWALWPALVEGTPLQAEHEERWSRLLDTLDGLRDAKVSA